MAGRIPQAFIQELIGRADIVEIVGSRVSLKKAGSNYKGLCPFHGEKTPSFTVSPTKGFYHCFGCSAHGTAIDFLMNHDNLSFPEAVEALAEMLGLEVPRTDGHDERPREGDELLAVMREADQIYRHALRESQSAIQYLKQRGIDGATAGRFGMGYAPAAWDTLRSALGASEARVERLAEAGLLITNESGRRYDRFRDRIMFPIRNVRGQVIGFGGRVLGDGEPKYLNSPETPIFRKGHELYGLYEVRQHPGKPKEIIVVEGYLDVASLVQHGIENVVATLGTATTGENMRRLTRLTERVLFCFDGDPAGRAAAWRALETALPFGGGTVEIKFLLLPDGEDPDSFVRSRGPEAFRVLAAEATPLSDFLVKELAARVDFHSVDGRARFEAMAKPLLKKLPEGGYREAVLTAFGQALSISRDVLDHLVAHEPPAASKASPHIGTDRLRKRIQAAIKLALHYPKAAVGAPAGLLEEIRGFGQNGTDLLGRVLEAARRLPEPTTAGMLENLREDPHFGYLNRLVGEQPLDAEEQASEVLNDALERIVGDAKRAQVAEAVRTHRPRPLDDDASPGQAGTSA